MKSSTVLETLKSDLKDWKFNADMYMKLHASYFKARAGLYQQAQGKSDLIHAILNRIDMLEGR